MRTPTELVQGSEPYILRDYRGMVVEVHPFQYLPDSRLFGCILRLWLRSSISASAQQCAHAHRSEHGLVPDFEQIYQRRFINYGLLRLIVTRWCRKPAIC